MIDLKKVKPTKLLWIDLEMTGLDPSKDVILEISAIVTDFDFKPLANYDAIIKHSDETLGNMNEWSTNQHKISGLTERVRTMGRPEEDVKQELVEFIRAQFGEEPAVLAGNSIHSDRLFIRQHWPEVNLLLHYRMLDVSSFKVLMQGKFGVDYEKKDVHRAADDIRESIAELQFYLDWFKSNH